ncbi:MAG TPA: GGDEF domain-containing protein [Marinagarivorans sp.]
MKISLRTLFALRVLSGVATVLALAWVFAAPKQHVPIHPSPHSVLNLFDDRWEPEGKSVGSWVDRSSYSFTCSLRDGARHKVCGVSSKFYIEAQQERTSLGAPESYDLVTHRDLSGFDGLIFDFNYAGDAEKLRFFVRNAMTGEGHIDDIRLQKINFAKVYRAEFLRNQPIYIDFDEFTVADWWIDEFDIRREHVKPTFDRVVEIVIDLPAEAANGEHHFELRGVTAVGDWVPEQWIYWAIITSWLVVLGLEAVQRYYSLARHNRQFQASLITLEESNRRDPLTGAFNRRGLEQVIANAFDSGTAYGLAVLVFDIDHFKHVNDTYGHGFGDRVLVALSQTITTAIRSSDKFARWGGEEFVLLADSLTPDGAAAMANKLRLAIAAAPLHTEDGQQVEITVSIGVAVVSAEEATDRAKGFAEAFKRADAALYKAKAEGRNRVVVSQSVAI